MPYHHAEPGIGSVGARPGAVGQPGHQDQAREHDRNARTSDRRGRSPRTSQASREMISTSRLPTTVPSPAPIAPIA